jgi:rhodanese-related sulfurtransferase
LEAAVPNLIRDAFTRILVVSDDGRAGIFACRTLNDVGYREVFNLAGGFQAWKEAEGHSS